MRFSARVLDAQRREPERKRAIAIIKTLADKKLASTEDLFFLARLEEVDGNWPKALDVYHELDVRTKNARICDGLSRRPAFLTDFIKGLLRHHKPGDEQDLIESSLTSLVVSLTQLRRYSQSRRLSREQTTRQGRAIDRVHVPSSQPDAGGHKGPGDTCRENRSIRHRRAVISPVLRSAEHSRPHVDTRPVSQSPRSPQRSASTC